MVIRWIWQNKYLLMLLLYGMLPLLWFERGYMIRPSEEANYIDYSYIYEKYLYSWSSHLNNGRASAYFDHAYLFPLGIFYKITKSLGIPNHIILRLVLIIFYYLTIFSTYKLIRYLTNNKLISSLSILFLTTTYYMSTTFFYTGKMFQLFLMPLLFYITIKYLKTKKFSYCCLNFIILFSTQAIFGNLTFAIPTFFVYMFAVIYHYLVEDKIASIKKDIKYIVSFLLLFVPIFFNVFNYYYYCVIVTDKIQYIKESNVLRLRNTQTQILDIFNLFHGAWWEPIKEHFLWANFYHNPFIIGIGYLLFAFLIVGLLIIKTTSKFWKPYLLWLVFLLIFIFLAHGTAQPFGFMYDLFRKYVPAFYIFRNSWEKFIPVVVFIATLLFAYNLNAIKKFKYTVYSIVLILVLINGYPLFTKNTFNHANDYFTHQDVRIPKYWFDAQAWSKEHKDDNVLTIPIFYEALTIYQWYSGYKGGYVGPLPHLLLYCNNVSNIDVFCWMHYNLLKQFNKKYLRLWNIKYVLNQKDIDINENRLSCYLSPKQMETFKKTLINVETLGEVIKDKPLKTFGKLDLYKIEDEYFMPRIYSSGF